jgi:type I restriction enzyme S subunit
MSLNLDKSTWKRVRLGDVIRRSRTQVDPVSSGVERYVAGGHVDSEGVTIERWGQVGDGQMGSTFRYVFEPGQVLFVSARPYLRKVGVPDFSGVVADKTYVLDAIPENGLLQELLPFVLSSEVFVDYATAEATGSMNPRLLWGPMQRYEFDLPPLDEQKHLADLFWRVERDALSSGCVIAGVNRAMKLYFEHEARAAQSRRLSSWIDRIDAGRSPRAAGEPARQDEVGVLKVSAVGANVFYPTENKRLLNPDDFRSVDAVRKGDLLVTRANAVVDNVVRPCVVDDDHPNLMLSDKTLRLVPKTAISSRVLLAALNASAYRRHVREAVGGTEAKNISQAAILAGPVPHLSEGTLERVRDSLQDFDRALQHSQRRAETVAAVRASLLADIF